MVIFVLIQVQKSFVSKYLRYLVKIMTFYLAHLRLAFLRGARLSTGGRHNLFV